MGKWKLDWWDINAPVVAPNQVRQWAYADAMEFIEAQFGTFSDRMAGLAKRAFAENWIDAEPRKGKQQGGYCMTIRGEESRVMINFEPSFESLQTLAHELGHAYHHLAIGGKTPLQRKTPMALAETASTFCQAVVFNAALEQASGAEKLAMLESSLQDACAYSVDIHSRFEFERSIFEVRKQNELSVSDLKGLMLASQRRTYADGIDHQSLHPYMWAAKIHYYMPDTSYYNWPYTFGMLLSFGLYSRYLDNPKGFVPRYDDLLASTGTATAGDLAGGFGIDINSIEFWRSSLDLCRERIRQFEQLTQL